MSAPPPQDAAATAFAELVTAMARLREQCPWDASQTHASLAPYAVEEAYEVAEAAESAGPGQDGAHLREELGDLLLQVVFHAEIARTSAAQGWDAADVVRGLLEKLVRRHPHVFGQGSAASAADVEASWEQIKAAERAGEAGTTSSVLHGIPAHLPALARAQKTLARARRAGIALGPTLPEPGAGEQEERAAEIGAELLGLAVRAQAAGLDAESLLRAQVRGLHEQVRAAEREQG